ncbi:hypothetical protein [Stutzerimonas stutzeri]|uniref:hypothetical protein n=1 Tax=Stutzerimonas stutzeri TaxID=316 RepID=UPI0026581615|nr:hypothetical protein [Stutzerimonas stutzeri]MCF6782711.1 hypothetical protein [Stutzerimonas stutzeri]MCF6805816.1 hypothetical protein [Stutzerimonas stutzeri]
MPAKKVCSVRGLICPRQAVIHTAKAQQLAGHGHHTSLAHLLLENLIAIKSDQAA